MLLTPVNAVVHYSKNLDCVQPWRKCTVCSLQCAVVDIAINIMQSAQASVLKCAQMHLHCMISSALCAKQRCTESVYMQSFYLTLHHNCTKLFSIVNCRSCSVNAFVCTILTASIYSFHNMLMHCTALMHCTDALYWCSILQLKNVKVRLPPSLPTLATTSTASL